MYSFCPPWTLKNPLRVFPVMVVTLPQTCIAPPFPVHFIRSLSVTSPSRPIISLVLWCSHAAAYPHIQTSSISRHGDIRLKFWYAHIGWLVTTDQLDKWWLGFAGKDLVLEFGYTRGALGVRYRNGRNGLWGVGGGRGNDENIISLQFKTSYILLFSFCKPYFTYFLHTFKHSHKQASSTIDSPTRMKDECHNWTTCNSWGCSS